MNLNVQQMIAIAIVILSVCGASTAQMTDLFGALVAKDISSGSSILVAIMSGVLTIITGQSSQVKAVAAMPGIEPLKVNAQANPTLAAIAVDPANTRIDVKPGAEAAVNKTAAG